MRVRDSLLLPLFACSLAVGCASAEPPPLPPSAPPLAPPPATESAQAPSTSAPAQPAAVAPEPYASLQRAMLGGHGAADVVESVTTDVGPRLAGSPGDKLAVAWALKTMKRLGLANVHTEPVKVPVWQRGVETATIVGGPVPRVLAIAALGWSGITPPKGVEADVVRFETLAALKAADAKDLKGKIVFLDVRMKDSGEMGAYGAAVGARGDGPGEAAKKGALAIVIRSIATDSSRFPHTGAMHKEKDAKSALPAGALSSADASLLERVMAERGSARLALRLEPKWLPEADSANVVGEIPGTDKPAEVVVLGAHLDSWDLGEGAIDDGAGCGIVLDAGRALAALPQKPKRTIRVVLFAAEENSLSGGKEYARAHSGEAAGIVAALEADSGTGRAATFSYRGAPEARDRFVAIGPLVAALGVKITEDKAFGGADITPLRELGVPLLELEQEPARYFDTHHTANDVFARIDAEALEQTAAAFATVALATANMSGDFGRIPEAERPREKR